MSRFNTDTRVLVLYSEVMPYTLGVLEEMERRKNTEILLVYWDHLRLTPFSFEASSTLTAIPRSKLSWPEAEKLFFDFDPTHIWTSGRMDQLYLKANLAFKKSKPATIRIMGCDNQWKGTLKDKMRKVLGYWLYRKYFDFIWVPGPRQENFALNVGFSKSKIIPNLLTCSPEWFEHTSPLNSTRILYVGRLSANKNVQRLIDAFEALPSSIAATLFLRIVGSGNPADYRVSHPHVEFYPFESQEELINHGKDSDLFCLPSIHEPFGVVVHEFAAMGLPLVLSDQVGSGPVFLKEGYNGYYFDPLNLSQLVQKLHDYYSLTLEEKIQMGKNSKSLARRISPKSAVDSFFSL
ncbi:glycosyltransferase [Algoriphagus sp.]|uniref:glycosyltransferase n=1 Tax=Algoriphagus sp. TaxID=1872435 RepID=UPI002629E133|nr:glycosyltransferase [Algoriphagus sp.]